VITMLRAFLGRVSMVFEFSRGELLERVG
jgi:hypothetical protein